MPTLAEGLNGNLGMLFINQIKEKSKSMGQLLSLSGSQLASCIMQTRHRVDSYDKLLSFAPHGKVKDTYIWKKSQV